MIIKLLGDLAVFSKRRGLTAESKGKFFVSWDVTNTIPLGSLSNCESLKKVLGGRDSVDDLVFFRVDPRTAKPLVEEDEHGEEKGSAPIDPSLSCYDQGLAEGAFLFATVDPWSYLGDAVFLEHDPTDLSSAIASVGGPVKKPKPLPFTPLCGSSVHFNKHGDAVATMGKNRRRLVKYPESFEPAPGVKQQPQEANDTAAEQEGVVAPKSTPFGWSAELGLWECPHCELPAFNRNEIMGKVNNHITLHHAGMPKLGRDRTSNRTKRIPDHRTTEMKPEPVAAATSGGGEQVSSGVNNSWSDSVGLANVCLNNAEINRWGFRVYWDPELMQAHVAQAATKNSGGRNNRGEEEDNDEDEGEIDSEHGSGGDDSYGGDANSEPNEGPLEGQVGPTTGGGDQETATEGGRKQSQAAMTQTARRGNLGKLNFEQNRVNNNHKAATVAPTVAASVVAPSAMGAGGGGGPSTTATSTPRGSVSKRAPSEQGDVGHMKLHTVPHVALGVADVDIPLDEAKQHVDYLSSFMLDVQTGAFYLGAAKRPIYADAQTYKPYSGMILNFALETEEGVLNILQDGQTILVAQIPRMLADSLHPCAELYSEGAVVELV